MERDYYSGFDEAVKHTLGVFLPVLRDLVSKNRLKVYVHPIPPVLDVTRAMVIRYNAFYKNAIAGIRGTSYAFGVVVFSVVRTLANLHWGAISFKYKLTPSFF